MTVNDRLLGKQKKNNNKNITGTSFLSYPTSKIWSSLLISQNKEPITMSLTQAPSGMPTNQKQAYNTNLQITKFEMKVQVKYVII